MERLREAVLEEFARIGREAEARVLCEALEITDESWRNAVEGYLNTQRFYLLVEPENFDIALGTYDRLRREKKAYGVGLSMPAGWNSMTKPRKERWHRWLHQRILMPDVLSIWFLERYRCAVAMRI